MHVVADHEAVERVGPRRQAEAAGTALAGALAGEVAHRRRRLAQATGALGQHDDDAGTERAEDAAVIEVSDTGTGLGDEQRARIFERFYRADPSRSRAHGGAGLGLSIAAGITEAHGGVIRAHASPAGGTTIELRLPLVRDR